MSGAVTLKIFEDGRDQPAETAIAVRSLVSAGWTGRDGDAVEDHIAELAAIGVKRPKTIPCFDRVAAAPARRFEFEIEDPVPNRRIHHGYDIRSLPIEG